jgi:hypothetical protein
VVVYLKVYIEVSSSLNRFYNGGNEINLDDQGIYTIQELLQLTSIPEDEVGIIIKNGKKSSMEDEISDGDTIKFFPPIIAG